MKLMGLSLFAGTKFHFFIDFAYVFRNVYFKEMLWMVAPTKGFHSFVCDILSFNGITGYDFRYGSLSLP